MDNENWKEVSFEELNDMIDNGELDTEEYREEDYQTLLDREEKEEDEEDKPPVREEEFLSEVDDGLTEDMFFEMLSDMEDSLVALALVFFPHYCKLEFSPMHHKLSDILITAYKENKNGVIILPRGFAKSTFTLLFFLTWLLLFTKEKYIIMIGESFDAIIKHLGDKVAREVETNKDLHLFGIRKGAKWTISKSKGFIEVIAPDGEGGERTVIIEAKSAGGSLRGSAIGEDRPGVVLIDDLERQKNGTIPGVESPAYRAELMKWFFGQVVPLGQGTNLNIYMLGTIMHVEQLLVHLHETKMKQLQFFSVKYGYRYTDKKGNIKSLWEAQYTLTQLAELEHDYEVMGQSDLFANEYLSITHDAKNAAFKPETYRYFRVIDGNICIYKMGRKSDYENMEDMYERKLERNIPIKKLLKFTAIDPAISEKEKACYSSIATVAVDKNGNWYIIDITYGRWNPDSLWDQIFNVALNHKPIDVGIEAVGYQKSIKPILEKMMLIRKKWFNVKDIESEGNPDKGLRIRSQLQWRYNSNMIYHRLDAPWLKEYETELGNISNSGTKGLVDLPDSVALVADLVYGEGGDALERKFEKSNYQKKLPGESLFNYQVRQLRQRQRSSLI